MERLRASRSTYPISFLSSSSSSSERSAESSRSIAGSLQSARGTLLRPEALPSGERPIARTFRLTFQAFHGVLVEFTFTTMDVQCGPSQRGGRREGQIAPTSPRVSHVCMAMPGGQSRSEPRAGRPLRTSFTAALGGLTVILSIARLSMAEAVDHRASTQQTRGLYTHQPEGRIHRPACGRTQQAFDGAYLADPGGRLDPGC